MTIPYQMNCPHCPDGWCLDCVNDLADALHKANEELAEANARTDKVGALIAQLRNNILDAIQDLLAGLEAASHDK